MLWERSTPSCAKKKKKEKRRSAWKQQLNSCATDYCRGWAKTHFLSCCFAQESPLLHVVMTSTTNPPHESGAFQFSLTLRGVFHSSLQATLHEENEAMEYCAHTHTHTRGIHRCPWEGMVVWSSGAPQIPSHQHPSHWATGCLEARGTTTSCYTQCSVGEKVTFLHHFAAEQHWLTDLLKWSVVFFEKWLDANIIQLCVLKWYQDWPCCVITTSRSIMIYVFSACFFFLIESTLIYWCRLRN